MCGISGIVHIDFSVVNQDEIQKINDLIIHRGPDDEGFYHNKNFAFGHRRLSILDLSADGHQPMHYLDKYVITYNGEIYNYIEIKKELWEFGYTFISNTDTEVILAAYDKWGQDCVNKFNGMWSFAIYDKEKNILFCSRDRFGIKPFYYTKIDGSFVFGSEIKQLLGFYEEKFVNKNILIDFLVTGFCEHTNETFFENIYKLEQSHNLIFNLADSSFSIVKYYDIEIKKNNEDIEKNIENYNDELNRSIDFRLRSDVKVGTCLSGGLDSSTIATIASKKYLSDVKFVAIHAKSIEKATDESEYAKKVAIQSNLDLHIIEPSTEDFIKNIHQVVFVQEEPFGSPSIFMQYFVMLKAKKLGCKVMLDGQGGDETLLGYEKYYPSVYLHMMKKGKFINAFKEVKNSNENNEKMNLYWILKYTLGGTSAFLRKVAHKKNTFFMKPYDNEFNFLNVLAKSYINISDLQKQEIKCTNLPMLLRYEDKNSMYHSVEARLPFLDYKTLENALNIKPEFKIKNGWTKYILRCILDKHLSKDIVWRKSKLGFNSPDSIWLNKAEKEMKMQILDSKILNNLTNLSKIEKEYNSIDSRLKWRLFNIAVWENIYDVKI